LENVPGQNLAREDDRGAHDALVRQ
jgi:hypothetical protein